jgi:hypothetical protein
VDESIDYVRFIEQMPWVFTVVEKLLSKSRLLVYTISIAGNSSCPALLSKSRDSDTLFSD